MLLLLLTLLALTHSASLTGQAAASFCHCDLTASFCDLSCCCDPDCTSSPSTECYNSKSNSFCPDATFFSRLGTTYLNSQGCFYYNSTSTVVEEVALSTAQIKQIVVQQKGISRVQTSAASVRAGYQQGDVIGLGGSLSFSFVDASGNCGAGVSFQVKFGYNMRLSCQCTGCTGVPQLYSSISGKLVNNFQGDTTKSITIPTFDSAANRNVQVTFIIGQYGSEKAKYIERVTTSASTAASEERTLNIVFVQPAQILAANSNPSFFPQIPLDMFHPIYLLS